METAKSDVLIVGAGIGGLTAALALAQHGFSVCILERVPQLQEVGAGIQISSNATRVLQGLGLLDAIAAVASKPECTVIRRGRDGEVLARLTFGASAEAHYGAPFFTLHRADLQGVLYAAALANPKIEILAGMDVTGFELDEGEVVVDVQQGLVWHKRRADVLVGADGLRSIVREKLNVPGAARYTGQHAWRSMIPWEYVPKSLQNNETSLWLGQKTHLVHYPLRGNEGSPNRVMNVVAVVEAKQFASIGNSWSEMADPAILRHAFAGWDRTARLLLEAAGDWRLWQLFDRDPASHWGEGPVTLLGDAAHPMLPFLAQGASQALEDAASLARHLSGTGEVAAKLRAYEKERAPRTAKVQLRTREQAKIYHMGGPPAFARDMAMKFMGPERMMQRMDWIYRG